MSARPSGGSRLAAPGVLVAGRSRPRPRMPWAARRVSSSDTAFVAVTALVCLGALFRFWDIGHQGLWYDESDTALLMRFSAGRMLGLIPTTESTPPLYFCVAWVWVHVFGDGAAGLRSLSAVCGAAMIPVAYLTASQMVSRRAGLICAALTACSPLLVWYSQEARAYEMLALLSAVSLLGTVRVVRDPTPGRISLWGLAAALALATHYFALMLVAGEVVWMLFVHRRRRPLIAGILVVILCGAAVAVLAIHQNHTGNDSWIAKESLRLRLAQIVPQYILGTGTPARTALKFSGCALALGALALVFRLPRDPRHGALIAGGLALGGFGLSLAFGAVGCDDLITRNLIELWLPAAIAVSGGLSSVSVPRTATAAVAAGLCAIGIVAIVGVASDSDLQRPDWPGVARVLGDAPPAGQARAILIQRFRTLLPLSLRLPHLHVLHHPARVSEFDVIAMRSPRQPMCWWGAECNLYSSRMQRGYRIAGLRVVARRRVSQFEITELRAAQPILLSRAAVSRSLSTTELSHDELMVQPSS